MAKAVPFHIRWMPAEWAKVGAALVDFLDAGMGRHEALQHAQRRALPPERWRDDDSLKASARTAGRVAQTYDGYVAKARKLSPAKRMELLPLKTQAHSDVPPAVEQKPKGVRRSVTDEGRDYTRAPGSLIKWTEREKLLLGRRVLYWRNTMSDTRPTARLFIEAQEIELPRDRRRPLDSLYACWKNLEVDLKMVKAKVWQLDKVMPFDPNRTSWGQVDQATTPPTAETPAEAPQTAQAAPVSHGGTSAPAAPQWTTTPAAQAFSAEFTAAVDKLMRAQQQTILEQVNARLGAVGESMAKLIAVFVTNELKNLVHGVIETELGGPVAAPAGSAAGALERDETTRTVVVQQAPAAPPKPRVKIDVVGFNLGADETRVAQALNGSGGLVELHFVNSDKWKTYSPHNGRYVVMMQARIPHALSNKLRASKVEPIYTKPTVGHVVTAINGILRTQGLLPAGH